MKSVERLLVIGDRLSHGTDDRGLWISTKSWLQNTSKLWIPVVDEQLLSTRLLAKLIDNITKCQKRPVDILALSPKKYAKDTYCGQEDEYEKVVYYNSNPPFDPLVLFEKTEAIYKQKN